MIWRGCLFGLAMLFVGAASGSRHVLHLEIVADGGVLWSAPIDQGEQFDVAYEHSRERSPWIHHYIASANGIALVSSTFTAYGAGMPVRDVGVRGSNGFTVTDFLRVGELRMMNWRASNIRLRLRGTEFEVGRRLKEYQHFRIQLR